jgi:hypothetical protein
MERSLIRINLLLASPAELLVTWCSTLSLSLYLFCSDVGDSPSDHVQEDMDSEVYPSEDGEYILVRRGK